MPYALADDGVRLFTEVVGEGPQTVIIPNAVHLRDDFARLANDGRTLIFYDMRNRGRSDAAEGTSMKQEIDDLEAVRRHFGVTDISLIGHSYLGLVVVLYAMKYPQHVRRIVQIGAPPPDAAKEYPNDPDPVVDDFMARIKNGEPAWPLVKMLYVADPANAEKIRWPSGVANESAANVMQHVNKYVLPSVREVALTDADFARVTAPVLTVHGRKDRHAPYGGGEDWVKRLPNARLLTVENAAHYPWVESPDEVFGALEKFLGTPFRSTDSAS